MPKISDRGVGKLEKKRKTGYSEKKILNLGMNGPKGIQCRGSGDPDRKRKEDTGRGGLCGNPEENGGVSYCERSHPKRGN